MPAASGSCGQRASRERKGVGRSSAGLQFVETASWYVVLSLTTFRLIGDQPLPLQSCWSASATH
jgi:hypothetical protein